MMLRIACLMTVLAASAAFAEGMDHMAMGHGDADSPSTKGYKDANMAMHKDMDITYSGDADKDFVAGMIPHHQGAVDMAKVELRHGKDPEIRKFAQQVIDAQTGEIKMMRDWQAKHDPK